MTVMDLQVNNALNVLLEDIQIACISAYKNVLNLILEIIQLTSVGPAILIAQNVQELNILNAPNVQLTSSYI